MALSRDYRELFLGNQVKLLISTYMVHGRLEFLARGPRGDPEKVLRALLSGSLGSPARIKLRTQYYRVVRGLRFVTPYYVNEVQTDESGRSDYIELCRGRK